MSIIEQMISEAVRRVRAQAKADEPLGMASFDIGLTEAIEKDGLSRKPSTVEVFMSLILAMELMGIPSEDVDVILHTAAIAAAEFVTQSEEKSTDPVVESDPRTTDTSATETV